MLKRGTMLDATLIEAVLGAGRAPSGLRAIRMRASAAPRARAASTFGYKAHVGVDEGSGLIRTLITTPANVNETVVADALDVRRREGGAGRTPPTTPTLAGLD